MKLISFLLAAPATVLGGAAFILDMSRAKTVVDDSYINYNIDTGSLYNGMNFSDTKFRRLVSQLAPAWIRIGGTAVDASYYFPDAEYNIGVPNPCASCGNGASAISNAMLKQIVDFMNATSMRLLWDFNGEGDRFSPLGPWNPALNATPQLDWLQANYAGKIDFAFSIGNEVRNNAASVLPPSSAPSRAAPTPAPPNPNGSPTCGRSRRAPRRWAATP